MNIFQTFDALVIYKYVFATLGTFDIVFQANCADVSYEQFKQTDSQLVQLKHIPMLLTYGKNTQVYFMYYL